MTAHLALARALAGNAGSGVNGRVGEVMLLHIDEQPETGPGKTQRAGE